MTAPPLPDTSCVRVRLDYKESDSFLGGSRFFISYAGSAPTGAQCTTLAGDIETAWAADLAPLINENWSLVEVDVLDITTLTGLSGQWTGSSAGTRSGTPVPAQIASGIEYDIERRYRGGKPRMYLPPALQGDQLDGSHWGPSFVAALTAGAEAFFGAIEALTIGGMGALQHINLSYYDGFKNVENTSGRMRAVPQYRATALHDNVVGYAGKAVMSSQKRRRTATTY